MTQLLNTLFHRRNASMGQLDLALSTLTLSDAELADRNLTRAAVAREIMTGGFSA